VLVDTSGALKGKRVVALDDGALCDDGTFYIWKGVNGQPEQIDNDLLRQKKITAVHGTWFFCSDGTMVESGRRFKDATRGSLQTPVLDQGVLKGKTITSIIRVVTPNAAKSTAIKQPIEPLVEWVALCSDGTLAHWLAPKLNTTDFRPIPPLAPPSAFTFPDSLGVLRGKTITTLADGEEALALCSDGTLVAWKKVAPPAKGRGRLPQMAENNVPSVTENKAQNAPVAGVDYPIVVSGTDLLKGKQVTHIFDDGLIACADGTLIRWRGQGAPFSVDHNQALRGKTILMLDRNIALFQEPDPAKNPADTTADAPASSTPAPLPQ
jgi:hypothetical protein